MSDIQSVIMAGKLAIIGTLLGTILGFGGTMATSFLSESFKRRDRALADKHKEIDRDSAERSRRLDLYKTVYPEKFNASRELMHQAVESFRHIHDYRTSLTTPEPNSIRGELKQVFLFAHSVEWILGAAIKDAADEYQQAGDKVVRQIEQGKDSANDDSDEGMRVMMDSYNALTHSVRHYVHIEAFDDIFQP